MNRSTVFLLLLLATPIAHGCSWQRAVRGSVASVSGAAVAAQEAAPGLLAELCRDSTKACVDRESCRQAKADCGGKAPCPALKQCCPEIKACHARSEKMGKILEAIQRGVVSTLLIIEAGSEDAARAQLAKLLEAGAELTKFYQAIGQE